jgi:transcriptional regulator with GAF, ATPase, and Fis domain
MENLNIKYNRKRLMHLALKKYKGNIGEAARALGTTPKTIKKELYT